MCDYLDDYADNIASRWVMTRRPVRCFACREMIPAGARSHVNVAKCDGEFQQTRHCARCWAICEALWAAGAGPIDLALDCGERWEDTMGRLPEAVAGLAFVLPGDPIDMGAVAAAARELRP